MVEKCVCQVVPVLLRPDPVSPNTACFGVVLKCDAVGYQGFKLAQDDEQTISRIVGFFPKYGRANFLQAMKWAATDIAYAFEKEKERPGAFANLIRPRENVVRYGAVRVSLATDPEAELVRQYADCVT